MIDSILVPHNVEWNTMMCDIVMAILDGGKVLAGSKEERHWLDHLLRSLVADPTMMVSYAHYLLTIVFCLSFLRPLPQGQASTCQHPLYAYLR